MAGLLAGCSSGPVVVQRLPFTLAEPRGTIIGPILFNTIEFNVEVESSEAAQTMRVLPNGVILLEEEPIVSRERYSIYEVAGRRYHFENGSKVYVVAPRPGDAITLTWRSLRLVLEGSPQEWYTFSLRRTETGGEEFKFGRCVITFEKERFFFSDGSALTPDELRRGLQLTRRGTIVHL